MALTAQEIDSVRNHLGYGNLNITTPYTGDGGLSMFEDVVSPALSTANETTATEEIEAGAIAVVTPVSMTGIDLWVSLVVDVGEAAEIVVVQAVTLTTFTARFQNAHSSFGYPIGTLRGTTRLRQLLWQAEQASSLLYASSTVAAAGLKSVDKGDVVWFEGGRFLKDRLDHYMGIVCAMASLLDVRHQRGCGPGRVNQLETY